MRPLLSDLLSEQKNSPYSRVASKPTLLRKLLAPQLHRENSISLQAVRFIVGSNFFLDADFATQSIPTEDKIPSTEEQASSTEGKAVPMEEKVLSLEENASSKNEGLTFLSSPSGPPVSTES